MSIIDLVEEIKIIKKQIEQISKEIKELDKTMQENMEKHSAIIIAELPQSSKNIQSSNLPIIRLNNFERRGKFSPKTQKKQESIKEGKFDVTHINE